MDPRNEIRNPKCDLCPLHEGAKHVCLMGDGPVPSRVMVIGEAPGAREDANHQAFVGPAGKLLNELLREAGLQRKDTYITNVAKCRPPENRTPKRGEVKICVANYLWEEIDAVRPSFILTVGNSAMQGVLGRSGIKKHRGTVQTLEVSPQLEATVLATYHPSFILRNPFFHTELRADVNRFARIIRGEDTDPKTRTILIDTRSKLASLYRALSKAAVISFDLETAGLQEFKEDSAIATIGFTISPGLGAVVPIHHPEAKWKNPEVVLRFLKPVLERTDCKYVGHNAKFDQRYLAAFGIFVPLTFDTMLAGHMIDENRPKRLKSLAQVLLGAHAYDVGVDVKNALGEPIQTLARYNAKDTDYTYRLYHRFKGELLDEPRTGRIFSRLMMPASHVLTKAERIGLWCDPERIVEREEAVERKRKKILKQLYEHVPDGKRYGTASEKKQPERINFNSPQQVAEWLFSDLGLPILDLTGKEAPSTNESVLKRLAKQHPGPALMLRHRNVSKLLDTYLTPWRYRDRDEKSRIHTYYKLYGTVTGRLSSEGPNLQQVPRDPYIRSIFGAPPGWKFISADYSQIELRIAAMLANENRMLRVFLQGRDIHAETASELLGKPADQLLKEERKMAKAVNFGFLYGMGAKKFVDYARDNYDLVISEEEAQEYRDKFFQKWPRLPIWHDRQRRLVRRYGRVQSPIGRVRHLPDIESDDHKIRGDAERQAINSPVQSFASDLMLIAMIYLDQKLPSRQARIVGTVHDQLLFEAKDEFVDEAVPIIQSTMEDMGNVKRMFGTDVTVPIAVDVDVTQHWSEEL